MTDRTASMLSVTCTSNTNWGFFRMFTQKRRGKLEVGEGEGARKNIMLQCFPHAHYQSDARHILTY